MSIQGQTHRLGELVAGALLLTALVGLLGPLLIVGMGVFVIGIVFAMLLPIFQMNSLIR